MRPSLACPGCGAAITLASSASVYVTCPYCKSTLIHDKDWSLYGKAADLPPEITYLQVGTKGIYQNEPFELIGRRRMRFADGYWTEWCALFPKGKIGWLAEAQGTFTMMFEAEPPSTLTSGADLKPGSSFNFLLGPAFTVDDYKEASVVGTEGEMPYFVDLKDDVISIDGSQEGVAATHCAFEFNKRTQKWSAFIGHKLSFDEFQFQNLRELDGW